MKKYKESHASIVKTEPVYKSRFEVNFKNKGLSEKDCETLTECVISIDYDSFENEVFNKTIDKFINIRFSLNVMKGFLIPDSIIQKIKKHSTITLLLYNAIGSVFRKVEFEKCVILSYEGLESFDYESDEICELYMKLTYSNKIIKNKV